MLGPNIRAFIRVFRYPFFGIISDATRDRAAVIIRHSAAKIEFVSEGLCCRIDRQGLCAVWAVVCVPGLCIGNVIYFPHALFLRVQ